MPSLKRPGNLGHDTHSLQSRGVATSISGAPSIRSLTAHGWGLFLRASLPPLRSPSLTNRFHIRQILRTPSRKLIRNQIVRRDITGRNLPVDHHGNTVCVDALEIDSIDPLDNFKTNRGTPNRPTVLPSAKSSTVNPASGAPNFARPLGSDSVFSTGFDEDVHPSSCEAEHARRRHSRQ
jgi:hypothetical protein